MHTWSSRDLVQRCATDRDAEIWREFLDRFDRRIAAGVYRTLARFDARVSTEEQQDLLQEVYCRLLERRGRYLRRCRGEVDGAVGAYLGKVAESIVVDHLRSLSAAKRGAGQFRERHWDRDRDLERPIADWVADTDRSPEEKLLQRERHARFFSKCKELVGSRTPQRDLEVVYLALFAGWTSREISGRMGGGMTPSAVDSLVHRLKTRLAKSGLEVPRRRSAKSCVIEIER
jgi:RNA polymerase sigma factor (sigma-70 family)